jgi:hypothetical protein
MVEPVILELAVNGATPRHRNRHVPRTPAEITEAALAGIESGASIVHNHNDEPMFTADGVHAVEPYLAAWRPVLERHPDALLYPTMAAGARGIPVAQPRSPSSQTSATLRPRPRRAARSSASRPLRGPPSAVRRLEVTGWSAAQRRRRGQRSAAEAEIGDLGEVISGPGDAKQAAGNQLTAVPNRCPMP